MNTPLFYRPKATFGLDVGHSSVKLVQLDKKRGQIEVKGYGFGQFDQTATHDGEIIKPELVAQTINAVIQHGLIGSLTTTRIVASLPIAHIYTRILQLPNLSDKDLKDAVKLEAEQYIPVPVDDLYLEYKPLEMAQPIDPKQTTTTTRAVLMVASPQKLVKSYLSLFGLLKLEATFIEANTFADLRAVDFSCPSVGARIVIDVGARSSDIAIYDHAIRLVNTIATGGDNISELIAETLKIPIEQATQLKIHYGIAKSRWQAKLATALEPVLSNFANEVQKVTRYHHEHGNSQKPIEQIVLVGGGANMPGLADFLAHLTGIQTIICNPWQRLQLGSLQPPVPAETAIYSTAIGLALKQFDAND